MLSRAERFALLPEMERRAIIEAMPADEREELLFNWSFWGRPKQFAPAGDWATWLILAGRGFGKTRCGAEWIRSLVCGATPMAPGTIKRIALVGETAADCRDVMVEGDSGLLSVHPKDFRPHYEPSKRRVTWPNGAVATLYNAVEPDQLRGPQHDAAWSDELAKWAYAQETWDNLQFGLRLGDDPRQIVTTTPRPIKALKDIVADPRTVVTRGSMNENRANLAPSFISKIEARYAGTRLGRQEIDAEILDDAPDALWKRADIDARRIAKGGHLPDMQRVIIAIDPAASWGGSGDSDGGAETGIVVAGIGVDGRGYVLADVTCAMDPHGWATRAIAAYDEFDGDAIVAERNQGGDMVEAVIRSVRPNAPVLTVHASRGKVTRAEPIAALYAQGRVSHVGSFPALEDQMVVFTPFGINPGDRGKTTTGDRVDALVWALTNLFPSIIHYSPPKQVTKVKTDGWAKAFADRDGPTSNWKVG